MTTKPSIGRIVHVYTVDPTRQFNNMGQGPYAAVITQVFTDICINAKVLPPFADSYDSASILLDAKGSHLWWEWPPRV